MKQTEIGLIPDDWEVKSLNDIGKFIGGGTPNTNNANYWKGNIPWISSADISKDSINTLIPTRFITKEAISCSATKLCPKNTILIVSRVGVGKLAISNMEVCTSQDFTNLVCNYSVNESFVAYQLLPELQKKASEAQGTSIKGITTEEVRALQIPLPPLPEQQRIAKALSDVDALISTTEKLLQKKKNIKQGAMQELLTGKKRLPGFAKSTRTKMTELGEIPEDWEVKSLGDIFSIKHGYGFEGQFFSSENNQHIVVTPGNFKLEGGFQKQKQPIYYTGTYPDEFKLKPNNLIIMMTDLSKNSDTLGNPAIVPDDGNYYLHNQRIGLIQIHNDSFVKDYIYLLLCTKEYHESVVATAAGSTVKHTSPNRIYSINLIVSTSKEEQTAIDNVLSSMDKEIKTLNTKLEKYRNLKTAMMQQLLTGKIRL